MKASILIAALVAAGALPAAAQARDGYGGFKVEGQGGWDRLGAKLNYDDSVYSYEARDHKDGVAYGAGVGYDVDAGGLLFGVTGAINWSSTKTCSTSDGVRDCLKMGREFEVGGRIGKQIGERGPMVYVKGAYVNTRFESNLSDGEISLKSHDDKEGWRVGAGIEQKLASNFYVKAEYRYTRYKAYRYADDTSSERLELDRNQVIGGVGVAF